MGGSSNSLTDIARVGAGVVTGGISELAYSQYKKGQGAKRAARTIADQQKDARLAQETELEKKRKRDALFASNTSQLGLRRMALVNSANATRGGTFLTAGATIPSGNNVGQKTLLGQ